VQVGYEKYGHQADVEVIREWQERDNAHFPIEELNWTREGLHSKPQRVKRLEPDFRAGRFRLPAAVWNPNVPGGKGGLAYWSIAEASDPAHRAGQIIYRPYKGPSKLQIQAEKSDQGYRIVPPIKGIDEDRNVYDLVRVLFEEMLFFPFAPKDDLVDALSRIYDMAPVSADQHESGSVEAPAWEDS
jgi:hypothetical protein